MCTEADVAAFFCMLLFSRFCSMHLQCTNSPFSLFLSCFCCKLSSVVQSVSTRIYHCTQGSPIPAGVLIRLGTELGSPYSSSPDTRTYVRLPHSWFARQMDPARFPVVEKLCLCGNPNDGERILLVIVSFLSIVFLGTARRGGRDLYTCRHMCSQVSSETDAASEDKKKCFEGCLIL